jgi:hypothetical protein
VKNRRCDVYLAKSKTILMSTFEYGVIEYTDMQKFTTDVTRHLNEGWELHGNLIAILNPEHYGTEDAIIYIQGIKRATHSIS